MKPVVGKRNEFDAAEEHVDRAIASLPDEFKHPKMREWLKHYTKNIVREVAMSFTTAAASGIKQAAALICDPDFYATKKLRRQKAMERHREREAKEKWMELVRSECPTEEQIADQVRYHEREIKYCQDRIAESTKSLERLKGTAPRTMQVEPRSLQ